jgi:aminotransferase EvaB
VIPVADPRRALEESRRELDEALERVLESGCYVLGPEHDAFELELASYLGVEHCIGVASGTDALEFALRAVGCSEGDEVVVSANAGFYASAAALAVGCRLRYADVDPDTLTLSAETLAPVVTAVTKAVVVTHLYGLMADLEPIVDLCHDRGVALVEDCAQALGARRDGCAAGSWGRAAAFSFYPTKNLAALGDGGAVATDDDEVAERIRALRQYGWKEKYSVEVSGGRNSRLDELQAAVLRSRLPHLDGWNARRREIVGRYRRALRSAVGSFVSGDGDADEGYVGHLAVALVNDRAAVRAQLHDAGVATAVHYPIPDHRQPVWRGSYGEVRLPATEYVCEHVLTLPCFPELTDTEVERVCDALARL